MWLFGRWWGVLGVVVCGMGFLGGGVMSVCLVHFFGVFISFESRSQTSFTHFSFSFSFSALQHLVLVSPSFLFSRRGDSLHIVLVAVIDTGKASERS